MQKKKKKKKIEDEEEENRRRPYEILVNLYKIKISGKTKRTNYRMV